MAKKKKTLHGTSTIQTIITATLVTPIIGKTLNLAAFPYQSLSMTNSQHYDKFCSEDGAHPYHDMKYNTGST